MGFVFEVLPWVIIGIVVAVIIYTIIQNKKNITQNNNEIYNDDEDKDEKHIKNNYISYGIIIGMGVGALIGISLMGMYGDDAISYGAGFGMMAGILAGACIRKR